MSPPSRRAAGRQPRLTPADHLDRITPRYDDLVNQARLAEPLEPRDYDKLEAMAQAIARDIVGAFRGPSRSINPVRVSSDGLSVGG